MPTESYFSTKLTTELRRREFYVIKHADQFTTGVPDFSASRNKKTLWGEVKALKVREYEDPFTWTKVIGKDDMVQLATMLELARKAMAFYFLFQWTRPDDHRLYITHPSVVAMSVREKKTFSLGGSTTLEEVAQWV